jgi:hypothetical protein
MRALLALFGATLCVNSRGRCDRDVGPGAKRFAGYPMLEGGSDDDGV